MSIISVINPLNWAKLIKAALVAKYAGKPIRHTVGWLSGLLTGLSLGSPEHVEAVSNSLITWLTSEEFWAAVLGLLTVSGTAAEGVKTSKETKELKAMAEASTGTGFV